VLISPEHFEVIQRNRKLLLKNMQEEKIIEKKEREYKEVCSEIDALRRYVDDLSEKYKELHGHYIDAVKIIKEKDKKIEDLELIKHQHEQLVFGSKSEKDVYVSPDQLNLYSQQKLYTLAVSMVVKQSLLTRKQKRKERKPS
jgi:transposase